MLDHDPAVVARQLLMGFRGTHLLYVAAELGIADLLHDGPLAADEIAARLDAHRDPLHRVFARTCSTRCAGGSIGRTLLVDAVGRLPANRPPGLAATVGPFLGTPDDATSVGFAPPHGHYRRDSVQ